MKTSKKQLVLSVIVLIAVVLSACSKKDTPLAPVQSSPGMSLSFSPGSCPGIEIQPGTQVSWTNDGTQVGIIEIEMSADDNALVSSGELQPGESFTFGFPESGEFRYRCSKGGQMTGKVTILP